MSEYKPPVGVAGRSGEVLMTEVSGDAVMVDAPAGTPEAEPMDTATPEGEGEREAVPGSAACLLPAAQLELLLPLLLKHWGPAFAAGGQDAANRLVQALLLLPSGRRVALVSEHWEVVVPLLVKAKPGLPLEEWRELLGRCGAGMPLWQLF
jgi:hypothetical protein